MIVGYGPGSVMTLSDSAEILSGVIRTQVIDVNQGVEPDERCKNSDMLRLNSRVCVECLSYLVKCYEEFLLSRESKNSVRRATSAATDDRSHRSNPLNSSLTSY